MSDEAPLLIHDDGAVRILTVNRPAQRNALNAALLDALGRAIDEAAATLAVRVVVIAATGDRAFIAGADISGLVAASPAQAEAASLAAAAVNERIVRCSKPVIASINGYCMGAGLELAIACDIRLASTTAQFGLPEIRLGIMPGGGGTVRLARLIGEGPARALCMTGANIDATRAHALGLVTEVTEPADLARATLTLAGQLAKSSATALDHLKGVFNRLADCDFATAEILERKAFALCFAAPDQREGMRAFLEKREPHFS